MAAALRGTPSLLVVDDDPESLFALSEVLRLQGYSVATARGGTEALHALKNSPPSLMILDLVMPRMDGRELLARKRGDPAIAPIPVIVISGLEGKVEADASIRKPVEIEHLFRTIRTLLMRGDPVSSRV